MSVIKIGTRASALALKQTEIVIEQLKKVEPSNEYEIVEIVTKGDRMVNRPLQEFGGKAVFVEEFERAILNDEIHMAVHSSKDMPMDLGNLTIAGVIKAHDPRDVLLYRDDSNLEKKEIIVGTSSLRREIQLEKIYKNAIVKPLRGNVNTRLNKLRNGEYDAIVLAAAGLERLDLQKESDLRYRYFDIAEMIPACGQGIIAMETKKNGVAFELAQRINDIDSYIRLKYERKVLKELEAGCHEPIGIHFDISYDGITGYGIKKDILEDNVSGLRREVLSERIPGVDLESGRDIEEYRKTIEVILEKLSKKIVSKIR